MAEAVIGQITTCQRGRVLKTVAVWGRVLLCGKGKIESGAVMNVNVLSTNMLTFI